jgi:hypothetical protein
MVRVDDLVAALEVDVDGCCDFEILEQRGIDVRVRDGVLLGG